MKRNRIRRTTPGRIHRITPVKKKIGKPICRMCGEQLPGIPTGRNVHIRNLSKSKRSINRVYGGNLCSACSRLEIIMKARGQNNV